LNRDLEARVAAQVDELGRVGRLKRFLAPQILVSSRIAEAVEVVARLEDLGNLELKGLRRPVAAFNVMQSTSAADARPNLTVVARGPEA